MGILDFLACFAGIFAGWILNYYIEKHLEKREKEWPYISAFIHPNTGTSYTVRKNKKNEYKCYINGIRMPNKWVIKTD